MLRLCGFIYFLFFVVSCQSEPEMISLNGQAQGTTYHIKLWREKPIDSNTLQQQIDAEFARIDQLISTYRSDSALEKFNSYKGTLPFVINPEIVTLIKTAQDVYQQSNRCFDPTIRPLFELWGFQSNTFSVPSQQQVEQTLAQVGLEQLHLGDNKITRQDHPDVTLDLSGIGQGYSIGQIAAILAKQNIDNYLVEVGGEMLVKGRKPDGSQWRIAVERPAPNSNQFYKLITLDGEQATAVMTSGTYLHYFDEAGQRYSHVLDPRTGYPVSHDTVSVTTLMDDPSQADAWSTALLCLGSDAGLEIANQYNIPALFIDLKNDQFSEKRSDTIANKKRWEIK